jgi:hypothetical protein
MFDQWENELEAVIAENLEERVAENVRLERKEETRGQDHRRQNTHDRAGRKEGVCVQRWKSSVY